MMSQLGNLRIDREQWTCSWSGRSVPFETCEIAILSELMKLPNAVPDAHDFTFTVVAKTQGRTPRDYVTTSRSRL